MINLKSNKCFKKLHCLILVLELTSFMLVSQVNCLSKQSKVEYGFIRPIGDAEVDDFHVAESALAGATVGGVAAGKNAFSNGGAAGMKSGSNGAAGFASSVGKKTGFIKGGANKVSGFKNGGKKAGFANSSGYASKFGKKAGKYKSFAAGHKKVFGTIKTFHHNSGFKFAKAGSYGALGGASKGFVNKKAFAGSHGAAGFQKANKANAKGFAAVKASKGGFKKASKSVAGLKSGNASAGSAVAKGALIGGGGGAVIG